MAWRGAQAEHRRGAGGGLGEPEHHVDGGGLAGPVGAEEGDDLALLELEVDAAHGVHGPEVLGDPGQADGGEPVPDPGVRTRSASPAWPPGWLSWS